MVVEIDLRGQKHWWISNYYLSNYPIIIASVSNAWSERGGSAIKGIKTKKGSTMKSHALNPLQPGIAFLYPLKKSGSIEKQHRAVMG